MSEEGASPDCHVGDTEYFGLEGFGPQGSAVVHVKSAELLRVPAGIKVLGVSAIKNSESNIVPVGWAPEKDWLPDGYDRLRLHPISDIVLDPKLRSPQWWILVKTQVGAMGLQETGGLKIRYTSGGRSGTTIFPYKIATTCGRPVP
jgi:hypothetical protein